MAPSSGGAVEMPPLGRLPILGCSAALLVAEHGGASRSAAMLRDELTKRGGRAAERLAPRGCFARIPDVRCASHH